MAVADDPNPEELLKIAESDGPDALDAMERLGDIEYERDDFVRAESWYRRAADLGSAYAMMSLGWIFGRRDDPNAAEAWFLKASDLGDAQSMNKLGDIAYERGDFVGAEEWYRKGADLEYVFAIDNVGFMCEKRGDLASAESWYRMAAELGSAHAMVNLGLVLKKTGDHASAEAWFRRAMAEGDANAMNRLGVILRDRGDVDEAEELFRTASEAGELFGMENLIHALEEKNDHEGALQWAQKASGQESGYAWDFLGRSLSSRGEFDESDLCFEHAIELGYAASMLGLGRSCQVRGQLVEAGNWFQRAFDAKVPDATGTLDALRRTVSSFEVMNAIEFTTFDWIPIVNQENIRAWRGENSTMAERFVAIDLDVSEMDDADIRKEMQELIEEIASPTFDSNQLDIPEEFGLVNIDAMPKQVSLLDVGRFKISGANCLAIVSRHRMHDAVHYSSATLICLPVCTWILTIELEEAELVGAREAAVARLEMDDGDLLLSQIDGSDPYDPKWDGLIALNDDPLTSILKMTSVLRQSIALTDSAMNLKRLEDNE
jgi:TPR repeat protein